MPLRVIAYDGVSYRAQLLKDNKERYPVITLFDIASVLEVSEKQVEEWLSEAVSLV